MINFDQQEMEKECNNLFYLDFSVHGIVESSLKKIETGAMEEAGLACLASLP